MLPATPCGWHGRHTTSDAVSHFCVFPKEVIGSEGTCGEKAKRDWRSPASLDATTRCCSHQGKAITQRQLGAIVLVLSQQIPYRSTSVCTGHSERNKSRPTRQSVRCTKANASNERGLRATLDIAHRATSGHCSGQCILLLFHTKIIWHV